MKKRLLSIFLVFLLCLAMTVTAYAASDTEFVLDEAGLLSTAEVNTLNQKLETISQTYNAQVVVATLSDSNAVDVDHAVENIYDSMGLGYGNDHDGVLLLVSMVSREYRILSNGFAAGAIEDDEIDIIGDAIVYDLSDGAYFDAFMEFADQCDYYLDGHLNGFPFAFSETLIRALVIGVLAGVIVAYVLKSQLKSVRKQNRASAYVKPGSMHITHSSDLFLYHTVNRTRKASSSSGSSRSRSSRNVGGGRF